MISCKRTDKDSYRLTKKDWCSAVNDAFGEDRHPAMAVELSGLNLYIIGEDLFELLRHVVKEVDDGGFRSNSTSVE